MANNLDSNVTRKLAAGFLPSFESSKVLINTVNKQKLSGEFKDGLSGDTVDFRRPQQARTERTADGDMTSATKNSIVSGKASGVVQDYITAIVDYKDVERALELGNIEEILKPYAEQCVIDLETSLYEFMVKNSGLSYGTVGTGINAWGDVAGAGSFMQTIGVPMSGPRYYSMNPFSQQNLADAQTGLGAGDSLVKSAWENAQIPGNFGGLRAISSSGMSTFTSGALAGESGTLAATPDATYLTHKDSMIQTLQLTGLTISTVDAVRAGDVIEFTGTGANGRERLNIRTRKTAFGPDGLPIKWRCTVVTGGDTDGSGNVTVTVTAPAIQEANGQYNNINNALTSGDAFTIQGAADTDYQPNLFYHQDAFGLGTAKLTKLHSTDTVMTTQDGLSIRVSKYANGDANTNTVRFDLLPAFAVFNPQFAGTGWKA